MCTPRTHPQSCTNACAHERMRYAQRPRSTSRFSSGFRPNHHPHRKKLDRKCLPFYITSTGFSNVSTGIIFLIVSALLSSQFFSLPTVFLMLFVRPILCMFCHIILNGFYWVWNGICSLVHQVRKSFRWIHVAASVFLNGNCFWLTSPRPYRILALFYKGFWYYLDFLKHFRKFQMSFIISSKKKV